MFFSFFDGASSSIAFAKKIMQKQTIKQTVETKIHIKETREV
jgi:hypothetical protein